jgi:hypothetical protein
MTVPPVRGQPTPESSSPPLLRFNNFNLWFSYFAPKRFVQKHRCKAHLHPSRFGKPLPNPAVARKIPIHRLRAKNGWIGPAQGFKALSFYGFKTAEPSWFCVACLKIDTM